MTDPARQAGTWEGRSSAGYAPHHAMGPRELARTREALPRQGLGGQAPKDDASKEALGRLPGNCICPDRALAIALRPAPALTLARPDTWPWRAKWVILELPNCTLGISDFWATIKISNSPDLMRQLLQRPTCI
jgi:hypothetical protein